MKKIAVLLSMLFCSGVTLTACGQRQVGAVANTDGLQTAPVFVPAAPVQLDFAGEKVPLEYADVLEALEREMTVTMFMQSRTLRTLRMTTRYFPVIEPILEKYGVPNDFKYLCMAESNLDPNAFSPARASGLWQIMASAAKDYGVETGENVDMRYNVELATEAACKYLLAAHKRYGSWTMAAASYNCGMAGASRRMDLQGVSDYYDLFLPDETMRYVYRILSFKIVTTNPQPYGFYLTESDYYLPFENYSEVKISDEHIEWSEFAAKQGTTYKMLRVLNPWIRSYAYHNKTKKTYTVLIPAEGFREKGY